MQVREIMTTGVECVSPETTIQEAASKMKTLDVGFLPICEKDRLAGTLTDRDIVLRAVAEGRDVHTTVRSIMSQQVFYCFEDDNIEECAGRMKANDVKRMLVLSRDKQLTGVVSLGDLSKARQDTAGAALKDITESA